MKSRIICAAALAAALAVGLSKQALALDKTSVLSLDVSKKMAAGCEAKAKEMKDRKSVV
jgi:hypothetical protein